MKVDSHVFSLLTFCFDFVRGIDLPCLTALGWLQCDQIVRFFSIFGHLQQCKLAQ